ncbi:hypothetical protein Actkin_04799 [Actinokineospora sp. UTMC 2448]|nr:hypothetical protein Actkin_04799 [Actinokineospora sp. UTMC 2448]
MVLVIGVWVLGAMAALGVAVRGKVPLWLGRGER